MREIRIVIGANFGDEGKGLMTDFFAAEAVSQNKKSLVVCSNGGAQRGHTVVTPEGIRHVFHHFGSGTLAGADTWLPGYFILNPMIFMNEYEELRKCGVLPKVYLNEDSSVTTPYDMIINQIVEQFRGNARHGSCGVGIWETLVRGGLTAGKMCRMTDDGLRNYLENTCRDYMAFRLKQFGIEEIPEIWKDIIDDPGLALNYIEDFRLMCSLTQFAESDVMDAYHRVIFENGQGLLLDRCRREYGCNTTPSNTGLRNPAELIREYIHAKALRREEIREHEIDTEVCYVTRTYLTRHGAGRFDGECDKAEINPDMIDMTNVPNPYQGTIRYGILDADELIKRIREDYDSERLPEECYVRMSVALTHLNEYGSDLAMTADHISDGETRKDVYRNNERIKEKTAYDLAV